MKTAILACKTLRHEIEKVCELHNIDYPIYWIESGLHNYPEKLHNCLQEEVNKLQDFDRVIMTFGLCGNALLGIKSNNVELIIPKVDDCISLMLGSVDERRKYGGKNGMYFLTKGWIEGERNLWVEYQYTIEKYGEETGKQIFNMMMNHYKSLGIIDTKCYDLDEIMPLCREIADTLELELKILDYPVGYIQDLLTGPWDDDRFVVVKQNSEVRDFTLEL
ncbi:DUF1638 domain-containing protein [Intestinibacter sp.]